MEKIKVASYQRISKGENIDDSLVVQKLILEKFAKDNSLEVIDNYVDIHKQAIEDRPAYNRLVKDIFEGKIDTIIVLGGNERLTRNLETLSKIEQNVKVRYVFPKLQYEEQENQHITIIDIIDKKSKKCKSK